MCLQRVLLIKCFATKLALKRLLRRVRSLVRVKRGSQSKSFAANLTFKRSLAGVAIDVSLQVSFLIEALTAIVTLVQAHF